MATESDGEEETTGKLSGSQNLAVDDDSREMAKKAAWSVSSCKPGNGVPSLRDDNLETYWQSDGAQPHLVNIQFQKKVKLHLLVLYVDYKLDESYTPSKISIRAGDGFHNIKEIKTVELVKPVGWVHISLSGTDPRDRTRRSPRQNIFKRKNRGGCIQKTHVTTHEAVKMPSKSKKEKRNKQNTEKKELKKKEDFPVTKQAMEITHTAAISKKGKKP